MATKESKVSWISESKSPTEVLLNVHGRPYCFNKKCLVAKSGKLAMLIKDNNQNDEESPLDHTFKDIPGDSATFYLAMRFCFGFEPNLTAENVVPLICLSHYLEMTEDHCPGNLLNKTLNFFQLKVLPLWDESIIAYQTTEKVLQQARHLGLLDACLDSILGKAHRNPRLLGVPFKKYNGDDDDEDDDSDYRPNARKRLFFPTDHCQSSEGLIALNLRLYELLISKMIQCGVPLEYVAGSLFRYAKKWANVGGTGDEGVLNCKKYSHAKEVIETVEKLLPDETGLLSCKLLFQMLHSAVTLQASSDCRHGFENRIGKQLNKAKVEDLMIPSQGYAMEMQYDIECLKRILKNFYSIYTSSDPSGLITVAELIEDFLAKVASEEHLTKDKFISLAAMSVATSVEPIKRYSDGIYRAVDVYLDKHRHLTESEKEQVCEVLDCYKMSPEACTHASQNGRLPLRVVVQALFVGQLQLKEAMITTSGTSSRTQDSASGSREEEQVLMAVSGDEEVKIEMERMDTRVMELENEYSKMRLQIEKGGGVKEKGSNNSRWKALKRKFGCISSIHDHKYCQVKKKVHPRNGVQGVWFI